MKMLRTQLQILTWRSAYTSFFTVWKNHTKTVSYTHLIPCPHFKITIVKRSQGQSAVAGAAYQSGERLFSEYDQKTKFYLSTRKVTMRGR